jgi:hypothetical protein
LRPWAVPAGAPAPVPVPRPATSAQRKPAPVTAFVPHKHPDYPDGPDLDPMLGARTPAFVEFLSKQR